MRRITKAALIAILVLGWIDGLSWALGWISSADDGKVIGGVVLLVVLLGALVEVCVHYGKRAVVAVKALLLLGLAFAATGCGSTIPPGHAGIVIDYYGKNRGVQDYTVSTGRVWYNPWTTDVLEWPTFVQSVVWTHNTNEGKPVNEEITFTNKDQMQIAADVALAYHLDVAKLPAFYVKFRTADMVTFTDGYLHSLARDKFNDIAGRYTIAQIMGDNGPFLKEVRDALQKDLEPYGVMIESQFGFIGAPRPPSTVIDAINQQAVAQRLALTKENELRQVQADAAKEVARAEGHARALIADAEGQARANSLINASLTSNLISLRQLEKWNGSLPQVSGGATPFINLTK